MIARTLKKYTYDRTGPNPRSEAATSVLGRSDSSQATECGETFSVLLIMDVLKVVAVGWLP
jgi:hypothetical protein